MCSTSIRNTKGLLSSWNIQYYCISLILILGYILLHYTDTWNLCKYYVLSAISFNILHRANKHIPNIMKNLRFFAHPWIFASHWDLLEMMFKAFRATSTLLYKKDELCGTGEVLFSKMFSKYSSKQETKFRLVWVFRLSFSQKNAKN